MAVFRSQHIEPKTIAMVPVYGYTNSTNYSADSIRWLDFVAESEGIIIQHALNGHGEKKIANISVDGFCHETNTVYQYHVSLYSLHMIVQFCFVYILFMLINFFNTYTGVLFPWLHNML